MKRLSFKLRLYFLFVISLYFSLIAGGVYLARPFNKKEEVQGQITEEAVTDYSDEYEDDEVENEESEPWVYISADKEIDGIDKTTFRLAFGVKEAKSNPLGLQFKPKFPKDKEVDPEILPADYHKSMVTILGYEGHGSGFVFDINEYGRALVMTNAHVVDQDSPTFAVLTYEGELLKVHNYDLDLARDVAVLEVYSKNLKALPIAPKKAEIGEEVISIGSPGRSINSINLGKIASASKTTSIDYGKSKKRFLDFAQIDVKVKEGNSGGPLLNRKGEVVGVICCVYKNRARSGFIDYKNMIYRINDYKENEFFSKRYLGIEVELQEKDRTSGITDPGYRITKVEDFGLAREFDLRVGDIITQINGVEIEMNKRNADYLLNVMDDFGGNSDVLVLEILRLDGERFRGEKVVMRVR